MTADTHRFDPAWATEWQEVPVRPRALLPALRVFAWAFMGGFLIGLLLLIVDSDGRYGLLMAVCGVGWISVAVAYIRVQKELRSRVVIR